MECLHAHNAFCRLPTNNGMGSVRGIETGDSSRERKLSCFPAVIVVVEGKKPMACVMLLSTMKPARTGNITV